MKVLLVEDNERVTRFVTKGLQEAGHTADHADNGRDGLFLAASERYDVIIMDRMLPGKIDGLAHHRGAAQGRQPVAHPDPQRAVRRRRAHPGPARGGDDYLTKPFAFGELLARLDALRRRAPGQRRADQPGGGRSAHGPAVAQGRRAARADPAAAARVQAARVPDAPCRPGGHAHHAAGERLGLSFRSADQRGRRAHQQAAAEDRDRSPSGRCCGPCATPATC